MYVCGAAGAVALHVLYYELGGDSSDTGLCVVLKGRAPTFIINSRESGEKA